MEQKNSLFGAPSLLVIFGVLFLAILAVLTAERAVTGKNASQLAAEQVIQHYAALSEGEALLAALREGKKPEGVREEDGIYVYSCEISAAKRLEYKVTLGENGQYTVRRRLVTDVPQGSDEMAEVWDGNFTAEE